MISLKSGQPDNKNGYSYSFTMGNDQKKAVNGFINYKILDNLFFRISSSYNMSNGFRKNEFLSINDSNKKMNFSLGQNYCSVPFKTLAF